MENKKVENNIFGSVVAEPAKNTMPATVLVIHLVVLVVPVTDDDLKGSGLNQ